MGSEGYIFSSFGTGMDIDSSLLRERFVIKSGPPDFNDPAKRAYAQSNRMPVSLQAGGMSAEKYVVRAHNMHSCARMVAQMIRDYDKGGPLLHRVVPYKWEEVWSEVVSDYEIAYHPDRWVCVYYQGAPIYQFGKHNPLLDVIEKCAFMSKGDYDSSLKLAEEAYRAAGKDVQIGYEGSMAIVAKIGRTRGRCGMIFRGPERSTTFNFTVEMAKTFPVNPYQCIRVAAALLEGIQLGFLVGLVNEKLREKIIDTTAHEARQAREAKRRLSMLNGEISAFETHYKVHYRPERPDFDRIILETEKMAPRYLNLNQTSAAKADDLWQS